MNRVDHPCARKCAPQEEPVVPIIVNHQDEWFARHYGDEFATGSQIGSREITLLQGESGPDIQRLRA